MAPVRVGNPKRADRECVLLDRSGQQYLASVCHPAFRVSYSGLNMAKIEISALKRHCLDHQTPDAATLCSEVAAWETTQNERGLQID